MENINPDNLLGAKKRQNKITEYRAFLQKIAEHDIISVAGYITGFPGDTKTSILRDIEIIKRELPVDILSIYFLTPLPGCEDHKKARERGEWMDPDLNKYDVQHRVSHHAIMSDREFDQTYLDAWRAYYAPEHIETVARRHGASKGGNPAEPARFMTMFKIMFEAEGIHPLEGGVLRLKYRADRRHGMPIVPMGSSTYRLAAETGRR